MVDLFLYRLILTMISGALTRRNGSLGGCRCWQMVWDRRRRRQLGRRESRFPGDETAALGMPRLWAVNSVGAMGEAQRLVAAAASGGDRGGQARSSPGPCRCRTALARQ